MGEVDEKTKTSPPQATVNEVNTPEDSQDDSPHNPECCHPERMDGAFFSIIFGAALPCLTILSVVGAVLGIIFVNLVDLDRGWPELRSRTALSVATTGVWATLNDWKKRGGNAAFYIDFNPSSLTAVASLSSKIIPYLSSTIMALVSFFAARQIIKMSQDQKDGDLLSPHQLSILIELLGGKSFAPIKDCVHFHVKKKQRWISPITHAFAALVIVTTLGIIIPVADTWFSTTVTPVKVVVLNKTETTSLWGRQLGCNQAAEQGVDLDGRMLPCNLDWDDNSQKTNQSVFFIWGAEESIATMNDISDENVVWYYRPANTTRDIRFMADKNYDHNRDFQTKSIAIETQCVPMASECLPLDSESPGHIDTEYDFNCSSGFSGSLLSNGATSAAHFNQSTHIGGTMAGISFASDKTLTNQVADTEFASFTNPLHFGAWSIGWQTPATWNEDGLSQAWDNDTEIYYDYYWNYAWMLNCTATVYEVTFSVINGSTIQDWEPVLAPADFGGVVSYPFVSGLPAASLCLNLASTQIARTNNSDHLADAWSKRFSSCATSLLAGVLEPASNLLEQTRDNGYGATRVPMVPLFVLLGLQVVYCVAVLILAIAAWHFTDPAVTQSVKERLSVKGLAAACFAEGPSSQSIAVKNVEQLFQDSEPSAGEPKDTEAAAQADSAPSKVAMQQTELGGWQFVKVVSGTIWTKVAPIAQSHVLSQAGSGTFGTEGQTVANWVNLVKK